MRSVRPRKMISISRQLQRRLNAYAVLASASGVGVAALAQPAEAKIVYSKADVVIATNHVYKLDLNHDGLADFTIDNHSFFTDTVVATLGAYPVQSNNAVVGKQPHVGYPHYAYALKRGATVGPKQPFSGAWMAWSDGANRAGQWVNVRRRYLGVKFLAKGKIHYGWARLNVMVGNSKITATLTGYAYETIANKPIIAGKTKGQDVIPEHSGSLGRLAMGRK